ncbi:MAG: ROK family protein [Microthrixaceae bacterium]
MPEQHRRDTLATGIDIGGTKTLAVLVGRTGGGPPELLGSVSVPSGVSRGAEAVLGSVREAVLGLERSTGALGARVGVGVAGYLDLDGTMVRSPNVGCLEGLDVVRSVSEVLGVDVLVENDANCVALAGLATSTEDHRDLVALTFGTGIGGGVVVDGRLLRGANGFAGEPGHMVVCAGGIECVCGQRGCWERYASGSALAAMAAPEFTSAEELVSAAREGRAGAVEVVVEFCRWLALGIGNVVNLLDPEVVLIGGGLASALDVMGPHINTELEGNPTVAHRVPPVRAAPHGPAAGAVGAAALAAGWC